MDMKTRMLRLGAVLPGIVLSGALTMVVAAMLPDTVGGLFLVAYVAAAGVLALGWLEKPAIRVLGRGRVPTVAQQRLLTAAGTVLGSRGTEVPRLYIATGDAGRPAAAAYGRRSVVVAPRVLGWLHYGQVRPEVIAAVIAQAAAGLRTGPSRFDLAVRLLTAAGDLVVAGFKVVAGAFTWVPGVLGLWRLRGVFGIVAVWQCLSADQVTIAVTTGMLMLVSYTGPACSRGWRRRVEAASDRQVAAAGMGEELAYAVRSADEPGSVERLHRIREAAAAAASAADQPAAARGGLYLVKPGA